MAKKILLTVPEGLYFNFLQHCEDNRFTKSEAIRQYMRGLPELRTEDKVKPVTKKGQ